MSATASISIASGAPGRRSTKRPVEATPPPIAEARMEPAANDSSAVTEKAAMIAERARIRRERLGALLRVVLPPLAGLFLFVCVWSLVAQFSPNLPGPIKTWQSAVQVFSDPFYRKGPNDQGIGWNILNSLQRVGIG